MIGKVLISEPFLPDPNFSRSVILIVDHNDDGTVGFVLNQKTDFDVNLVMKSLDFIEDPVYQGGPVELDSFHFIHTYGDVDDAIEVGKDLYWGGNFEQLSNGLKSGLFKSANFRFYIGYSGWAVGQLDQELKEKAWIVGDLQSQQIFNTNYSNCDLWKLAITSVDGDDALLANSPVNPWLN